jgi:hypothetical protein
MHSIHPKPSKNPSGAQNPNKNIKDKELEEGKGGRSYKQLSYKLLGATTAKTAAVTKTTNRRKYQQEGRGGGRRLQHTVLLIQSVQAHRGINFELFSFIGIFCCVFQVMTLTL